MGEGDFNGTVFSFWKSTARALMSVDLFYMENFRMFCVKIISGVKNLDLYRI